MSKEVLADFLQQRTVEHTAFLLNTIKLRKLSQIVDDPKRFARGFDYYEGAALRNVLRGAIIRFFNARKYLPKHPLECRSLIEKIFWSKFVVPLPLPSPADKLRRGEFIPPLLKPDIRVPAVIWNSDRADLPVFDANRSGAYYFKSNNTWQTTRRINLPLSGTERDALRQLGEAWLRRPPHDPVDGEWWYSTIKPRLFLEEEVVNKLDTPMECRFITIRGDVAFMTRNTSGLPGRAGSDGISIYGPDAAHVAHVQSIGRPNPMIVKPPDFELMSRAARLIGGQFEFARVDFYNPAPGEVYLGEITLVPQSGTGSYTPRSFEDEMGATWDMGRYVEAA